MIIIKILISCLFVTSSVSVSFGHAIVKELCPVETIYKFDRNEFISGVTKTIRNNTKNLQITHHESPIGIIVHKVVIVDKDYPDIMISSEFEGVVLHIAEMELDSKNDGKEFLVTDKPSARGYRYSIMNGFPIKDKTISLISGSVSGSKDHKKNKEFWSLPESLYPMFSDINNDGQCEIINFSESSQKQFVYPELFVSPIVYSFDSIFDKVDINENLNAEYARTLWNDQIYRIRRITNLIKQSKTTSQFHSKMPEFDWGVSAKKFLYCAKQVGKSEEASVLLQTLKEQYNNLEVDNNWYDLPVFD